MRSNGRKSMSRQAIKAILPHGLRRWLRRKIDASTRGISDLDRIDFGSFNRVVPISSVFGLDRGLPIDRYYIEDFLGSNKSLIHGSVLEMGDDGYTRRYGETRVSKSYVLNSQQTQDNQITTDLSRPLDTVSHTFDCIIFTQTLHVIFKIEYAIQNLYRMLKPNGVLLATFPGISQISRFDMDRWGDYWRLTSLSAGKLFAEVFGQQNIIVNTYGNVMSAIAFLHGLAAAELQKTQLDYRDPDYEVLITVQATKNVDDATNE